MRYLLLYLICITSLSKVSAQTTTTITGKVVDVSGKGIFSVNVKTTETNQYTATNDKGDFKLVASRSINSKVTLEITYLGYQKITKQIDLNADQINLGNILFKELSLSLEGIEVNATREFQGTSNSSLLINRDVIEQIPALSLSDLLNQIPNRKVTAPSLQNVQNLTLRSAFSPVANGRNVYEMSNSFGVAIILDGNTLTNNLNMQSYNPGIFGSSAVNTNINVGGYTLNGSPALTSYSGDFAYGGLDLRQIPADNIESIEVIAGVPSAKYGDLSEGAIVVERQAGKSPAYIRMQLRDNATSYGFSKGFDLGKKLGALNIGANYVNSFADNRDKLKAYNRLNLSAMHTNYFGKDKHLKNTFSIDYGRNLDGVKRDSDDPKGALVKFDSWNFSAANRTSYRFDHKFLKNVGLNLRYASGHQVSYTEEFKNDAYTLVSDATSSGIHEGSYESGIYTSESLIDGRPLNISAKLDFNAEFKTGNIQHFLSFGTGYSYGANNGLGQVLDANRPRSLTRVSGNSTGTNRSERYYDFNLAVAQQDYGFYAEDMFKLNLFNRDLNFRTGIRYDIQNELPSISPRININYEASKFFRFGLAYGISYKSPALGQRYPGPSYFEIPVINAYEASGKAAESIYLVYVNRFDPSAIGLKSSNSQTFEFSSQLKLKKYSLSLNAFLKNYRNGIGNTRMDNLVTLPVYEATFRPNQQPLLTQIGTKNYLSTFYRFDNNLASTSSGFDLIFTTPLYPAIATSFNVSGGIFRTQNKSENNTYSSVTQTNTSPDYAAVGIYPPSHSASYTSNARITSNTLLPKLSLFVQVVAEFTLLQKTVRIGDAGIPVAYYTNDSRYVVITNFNQNNPNYGHLFKPQSELKLNDVPAIIPNFHLSIGKEIKKRFKLAFNVYNFLNYQPHYIDSGLSYVYPNQSPTFGAELSLKL